MINMPPPLTDEQQMELLKKLPNVNARDELITKNLRLVSHFAKKYAKNTGYIEEDLLSIGTIGLIKAIDSYKFGKNTKLGTYAARCINNEILMYIRKEKKHMEVGSINVPIYMDQEGNELLISDLLEDPKAIFIQSVENVEIFLNVINVISNRLYKASFKDFVIFLYMISGKTQREVAKLTGISQSFVSRKYKKFRRECIEISNNIYSMKKDSDVYFFKDKEHNNLCLKLKGIPLIKTTLDQYALEEIADFLREKL